jgi:protein arginine kinase activator
MRCQRCGKQEASVHLIDLVNGKRTVRWLCAACAGRSPGEGEDDPSFGLGGNPENSDGEEDSYSLASFLGEMFEPAGGDESSEPPVCPDCGYSFAAFRGTNRLGCPRCYVAFRQPLLSILSHLHRHVSHLGKVPDNGREGSSPSAELSRTRIALEKAIAAEDFEKAARLRDDILQLESGDGSDAGSES